MNVDELNTRLLNFETAATNQGFGRARAECHINWLGEGLRLNFRVAVDPHGCDFDHEKNCGGWYSEVTLHNLAETFDEVQGWLQNLETPLQTRKRKFREALAHLVEEGRELDSPILADLEATMKRLSTNILEAAE